MKRILCILLLVCMLVGCGAETPAPTTQATEAPTTQAPTTEPTTAPTTEPPTEPTEPPVLYRHPLTGEAMDAPFTGRATAVVIDNIKDAMPQKGISQADILYEFETEGGITRCLAIFTRLDGIESIGPVRSARSYFNNIACAYDAPIIHCGGSKPGRNGHYGDYGQKISGWEHVDENANTQYFYRDQDRINAGYHSWDCLFTTGSELKRVLADKGFDRIYDEQKDYILTFQEDLVLNGETANTIIGTFNAGKTTTMTYDPATKLYTASQYNGPHIDANSGDDLTYSNVIAIYTKQWYRNDGQYDRSFYELIGEGTGHLACNGQIVPIRWIRPSLDEPFSFVTEDGVPVTLTVGRTYVGVFPSRNTVQYS